MSTMLTCDLCWGVFAKHSMFHHCVRIHAAFVWARSRLDDRRPSRSLKCDHCELIAPRRSNLARHLASRHALPLLPRPVRRTFRCDTCFYVAKGCNTMHKHMLVHDQRKTRPVSNKKISCDVCGHKTYRQNVHHHWLLSHTLRDDRLHLSRPAHNRKQLFRCDECEKTIKTLDNVINHSLSAHRAVPAQARRQALVRCEECGEAMARGSVGRHWARRHGPPRALPLLSARREAGRRKAACDHCGAETRKSHIASHLLRCSLAS